jgi:hypothetical protein
MKTQKLLKSALLLATVIIFSACEKLDDGIGIIGTGPIMQEQYQLGNYKNIEVDVDADVFITQGIHQPLIINGQGNILNNLCVKAENGILKINYLERVSKHERLQIYISTPTLYNLSTTRSADIRSMNAFKSDLMIFQVYGSGIINMEVGQANVIRSQVTGSGRISLSGVTEELDVVINGSGIVGSAGLLAQHTKVSITGSGECEVHSHEELSVNINGNGKVFYTGNPTTVNSSLSGNGELRQMQ